MPFYRVLALLLFLLLQFRQPGRAQQFKLESLNPALLQKLATEQNLKYQANKMRIRELAKKPHWFIKATTPQGQHLLLQGLSPSGKPLYYTTFNNAYSAATTNTNRVWTGGTTGLNLSGSSPRLSGKLGIWDGGAVLSTHQELNGRIVNRDGATNISDHATHVAGTMIATGINPIIKGMAYQAVDLQAWYFDNDNTEIANAASGLLLSNHSYGYSAGWIFSGGQWFWLGNTQVSTRDDVYFGYYDTYAQLWDDIAFHTPYYLIVKAAGNSRNMQEPAVGTPYLWMNQKTGDWETNTKGRSAEMRRYSGYDVIPDHSVAKNILTVGAIATLQNGYSQPSDVVPYLASSYGPTDDGRIKPDLVGNGIRVWSTVASANDAYQFATGTSMSAPNVTGSLLLLQEHYANLHAGSFMRAATLKGLAIHTAQESGQYPGPDYMYGWGVLDTDAATRVLSSSGGKDLVSEQILQQDSTYTRTFTASGTEPLKVTISWTDPKGQVLPLQDSTALNNRTPRLVNDLDITLSSGNHTYLPWILDPENPAAPAATGDNFRDNVEQVLIANPVPGATYTLTVKHKNTLTLGPQHYALIVSGLVGPPYCASRPAGNSRSRIEKVAFGTIQNTSATGCGTYSDYTGLRTHVEPGKTMLLSLKLANCDSVLADKIAKVFIDWNEDGDFADAAEQVLETGPLSGTATATANVVIPDFVRIGNGTRMRVVMVETREAAEVTACGEYGQGETEDYTLQFVRQAKDVGITALAIPTATTLWAHAAQSLTVKIRNFDALPQSNIPVMVSVKAGATAVATLTGTFHGTLNPLQEALFTLPGTFPVSAETTYDFTATTTLADDQQSANNTFAAAITSSPLSAAPALSAISCEQSPQAYLKGSGAGALVWFDAAAGGNRIGLGPEITTVFKPADRLYYAALNEFSATTLSLKNEVASAYTSLENDTIYFTAAADLILDRVSINAGVGGQATIKLLHPDGTGADSVQLTLEPGLSDYGLNLVVPASTREYGLMISKFYNGASAFHQGAGTTAFPYVTPALLTVRGSVSGSTYLYNWKFRTAGSPSARVGVKANGLLTTTAPVVCGGSNQGAVTLTKYHGAIARWEKSTNDSTWVALADTLATLAFQNLTDTTRFRVALAFGDCQATYSDPITIVVKPSPAAAIRAPQGTILCPGSTLALVADSASSYLWSSGDTTQQILVSRAGIYRLQVTHANGCTDTDSLEVRAKPVAWTGQADTDWFNAANWNCQVPDSTTDVLIPADLMNYPVIGSGVATCKDLVIRGALSLRGGQLEMTGNFTNEGTFDHPGGLVELRGTSNHRISGGNFFNLTVKSPGITTIGSDITVDGALAVENGTIQTGPHQILLGPEASISETENHFITGTVATSRTFDEVQTSHTFGGLGLGITTTAAPGAIQVVRTTGVAPGRTAIKRSFQIQVQDPGRRDNLDATLDFHYFTHELNNLDRDFLALFRSVDSGATWMLQENSVVDTTANVNRVSLAGIQAFSSWALAGRFSNDILPVNLLSFHAVRSQGDAILTWETAMEVNNAGMAIEVSQDARHYRQLHFLPARGINTTSRQQYQYTDKEAGKTGIRYYRLKQVDLNGVFTYYGPRPLDFAGTAPGVQVYPNPGNGRFEVLAQAAAAGPLELEIKTASGQTVWVTQKPLNKGMNIVALDLRAILKPGLYLVLARYDNQVFPVKMIVQ